MYAVIETGGKQYRVEVGTELEVELLDVEPGQSITLERVLLVADGTEATVGTPVVDGAAVEAEVVGGSRGDKVIAFKYRPKARRRVKKGHRQDYTVLRIADIRFGGKSAAASATTRDAKAADRKALEEAAARQAAEDAALAAKLNVVADAPPEKPAKKAKAEPAPQVETLLDAGADAGTATADAAAAEETPAVAKTKGFEIYEDNGGEWRWRLRASNGELVAISEEGFASRAGVIRTLDVVRRNVAEAEDHAEAQVAEDGSEVKGGKGFEIYEDTSGSWRWRLRAGNGELVAISEQGFSSKSGVVKGLDVVRRNAAAAEGYTEPDVAPERTTDAAPKRARTKKDS
ncbi:MAG TPA: 50S ribosomal protein L21 [Candidatus Limnocylindrales bacterium]